MRVLFIVQGEGRGHLTQAISMEKLLRSNGHEVVEVLVGKSESRRLPGFFSRNIKAPINQSGELSYYRKDKVILQEYFRNYDGMYLPTFFLQHLHQSV